MKARSGEAAAPLPHRRVAWAFIDPSVKGGRDDRMPGGPETFEIPYVNLLFFHFPNFLDAPFNVNMFPTSFYMFPKFPLCSPVIPLISPIINGAGIGLDSIQIGRAHV